ncbi:MAG: hypothetical protein AB9836_07125 [Aminipila sp.]
MPLKYDYKTVRISDLLLDDENPRFASSKLVNESSSKVTQEAIIAHLLKYADIIKLANRIKEVSALHGAELITCYQRDDGYVVLEGNRRTCACKLLLNRNLIPEEYKKSFPFVNDATKENIEEVMVIVYPNRDSVQAYLSDRHISGVKKWTALEKNNYYMNLFERHKTIDKVKEHTSDGLAAIRNSIRKYQFFMDVYDVIKEKYPDLEIEKIDYLPMVDRFLDTLIGSDEEVGLNLNLNTETLKYECEESKIDKYRDILFLVGEAFLVRKEKKLCSENEVSKIISAEISNVHNQKQLILENERIPGLLGLIQSFKQMATSGTEGTNKTDNEASNGETNTSGESSTGNGTSGSGYGRTNGGSYNAPEEDDEQTEASHSGKFIPPKRYKPKKMKKEYLEFFQEETLGWNINGDSDYEIKIHSLIYDLATISVYEHPYACAFLYRSLLEVCTRFTYIKRASSINQPYNENDLVSSMRYLNNNVIFANKKGSGARDIPKIKEAIKSNLSGSDIIQVLNLYIHYDKPVDEQILLSTWNSMKFYIQACLEK